MTKSTDPCTAGKAKINQVISDTFDTLSIGYDSDARKDFAECMWSFLTQDSPADVLRDFKERTKKSYIEVKAHCGVPVGNFDRLAKQDKVNYKIGANRPNPLYLQMIATYFFDRDDITDVSDSCGECDGQYSMGNVNELRYAVDPYARLYDFVDAYALTSLDQIEVLSCAEKLLAGICGNFN